ncbi:NPCBM/NEW2 domain-containing protein, partial [bacterium]|nr:NPCBM/NEW2 domain-containing protein [bacterium]
VDGKPAKEMPEGKKKRKVDAPDEIAVDVQGVKELQLVVDYGSFMHILGRADWADAHLVKAR